LKNVRARFSESLLDSSLQIRKRVRKLAKSQSISKNQLVGKSVIDQDGNLVGTVKDVGFVIGKPGVSLVVEDKSGETQNFAWDAVQGAADFVVLKAMQSLNAAPQAVQQTAQPVQSAQAVPSCPTCGSPLTWIPQYKRWYCYKDQKYI
jgi:sporulation protein YlmC with PRC-barrel domain